MLCDCALREVVQLCWLEDVETLEACFEEDPDAVQQR